MDRVLAPCLDMGCHGSDCSDPVPGGGGYSIYPWVGRCGMAPHTLTLFKTNIVDFPALFKTEFQMPKSTEVNIN